MVFPLPEVEIRYTEFWNTMFKDRCIGTELVFLWIPQTCFLTKKFMWLKKVYKQTAVFTGPGDSIFEHRYYDKDAFIKARLQEII